jgi:hypothetical protein
MVLATLLRGRFVQLVRPFLPLAMAPRRGPVARRRPPPRQPTRVPRPPKQGTLVTRRYLSETSYAGTTLGDPGYSISATLAQCLDSTEFTALFDFYRVLSFTVEFTWQPRSAGLTAVQYPTLLYYVDKDGAAGPTSLTEVQSNAGVKLKAFDPNNRMLRVTINRPGVITTAAGGNGPIRFSPLMDCSLATEAHYGFVFWGRDFNNSLAGSFIMSRVAVIEFSGVR